MFGQQIASTRFETERLIYVIESADGLGAGAFDSIEKSDGWTETEILTDHGDGTMTVRIKRLVTEEGARKFVRIRVGQKVL